MCRRVGKRMFAVVCLPHCREKSAVRSGFVQAAARLAAGLERIVSVMNRSNEGIILQHRPAEHDMDKLSVSIVIPCFNDGRYLHEAVASARAQTWPNKEIIVVNDHSTEEETRAILKRLTSDPDILSLSVPEGRKGPSAARNVGIAASQGDFILPLDADDKIYPTYVEKAVERMSADSSVGICYCRATLFGLKRGVWQLPPYSWEEMLAGNMVFATAMFRRRDWEALGGYDESLLIGHEDYAFWLRLISLGRQVVRIEEELFHYRVKPGSRTALKAGNDQEMKALEDVYRSCESILSSNALALFKHVHRLRKERGELTCLVSWKVLRFVFALEWKLRQIVKKMVGRTR